MGTEAKTNNYWIAPNAITISLNAIGDANRIQGSVASDSVVSCYMEDIKPESAGPEYAGNGDGLDLDNGRNPKRWPLVMSPTYFNSDTAKYVYVAIPRRASFSTQAVVVFPSEKLDLYGKNANDEQVGSTDYFYIWLQGIISAPTGSPLVREWTQEIIFGSLGTYEDIIDMSESDWYSYSAEFDTVTFFKRIIMAAGSFFQNIFLGDVDHQLNGVATGGTIAQYIDSDTLVATPNFVMQHYLRKDTDDTANGLIGFVKGLWVKAAGVFGFTEDGDVVARSLKATGSSGGTIVDTDNNTRKNLGLEVAESGIVGGIFRVGMSIMTKAIQSLNFTGGDSMFGTGWQLTDDDGNGNSRLVVDNLFVRAKSVFNDLEVRKFVAMGGNYVFSPAAGIIEEVDYIGLDENNNEVVLGYEYIKVPWVLRLVPLSIGRNLLSRKKLVRMSAADIDFSEVVKFRCWLKSDDGTTRTINTWQVGMLARCQTFDVSHGSGTHEGTWHGKNVTNKLYWRAVTAIGEAITKESYSLTNNILEDGLKHNYIDLANYTDSNNVQLYLTDSDKPEAFDNIVCYGNWLDSSQANLITIETVGSDAPAIKELLKVGYTDGTTIDWSLNNKIRTQISPVAGNKFVAPSFIVTTEGSADEQLYNEHYIGEVLGFEGESGVPGDTPALGSSMLVAYSDIENDTARKMYRLIQPGMAAWVSYNEKVGNVYVSKKDGHRYCATATGWQDRGLKDESKSSLKVDINGIAARVTDAEGNITQLQQTAAGLVSEVSKIESGANLLTGVLTGSGWKSGVYQDGQFTQSGDITVGRDGWFLKNAQADNCFAIDGITLEEGKKYMLSFCAAAVSDTGTPSVDYPAISCVFEKVPLSFPRGFTTTTNGGTEQRAITDSIEITETISGTYKLYIISPKIRYPQLEVGETATKFVAPSGETSSRITQTANDIDMVITNKLGETGIKIDGNNRSIELLGDKVTFQNSAGTLITPNVWIDPTDGSLHAVNGVFQGFVRKSKTIITTDNYSQYVKMYGSVAVLDFDKCGSFIELQSLNSPYTLPLPLLCWYYSPSRQGSGVTEEYANSIRELIGTKILIYNKSGVTLNLTTKIYGENGTTVSNTISNNRCACLECKLGVENDGIPNVGFTEIIYWEMTSGGIIV